MHDFLSNCPTGFAADTAATMVGVKKKAVALSKIRELTSSSLDTCSEESPTLPSHGP